MILTTGALCQLSRTSRYPRQGTVANTPLKQVTTDVSSKRLSVAEGGEARAVGAHHHWSVDKTALTAESSQPPRPLKILFASQYYPPESNAPAVRTSEMAERWAAAGHDAHVITAFPHHPAGVIPDEYRGLKFLRETHEGVKITRTWIYVAPNKGVLKRSISYVSWMLSAVVLGSVRTIRPDVVVATSPQFLCALAGYILSRVKRVPFVLEIRDLWPDSIVAVGAMTEGLMVKFLRAIERFLYRKADRVVVVSPAFIAHIGQYVERSRIHFLPNGVDLVRFQPGQASRDVYGEHGINAPFRVLYSGTVGMAHGLEIMIGAAEELREEPDIALVVVGDGARRADLVAEVKRRALTNVFFVPMQPRSTMVDWILGSSVALVHLRKTEMFDLVLPSKLFEYMGCGKAVLMGVRGAAAEVVSESGCGLNFDPENVAELVRLIQLAKANPEEMERSGRNGRHFAEEHFDRSDLARRYVTDILDPLVEQLKVGGRATRSTGTRKN